MIRYSILIISCMLISSTAFAQSSLPENLQSHINTILSNTKHDLERNANRDESNIIRSVEVNLVLDDGARNLAMASIVKGKRKIVISTGFIIGLRTYIDLFYIEHNFKKRHLLDNYFTYFWRMLHYDNMTIKSPIEYAGLTSDQREKFIQDYEYRELFFQNAIAFLLAHEFGHHVKNAFTNTNNRDNILKVEIMADRWAINAIIETRYPPAIGSFIANEYIYQIDKMRFLSEKKLQRLPNKKRTLMVIDETIKNADVIYSDKNIYPEPTSKYTKNLNNFRDYVNNKKGILDRSVDQYINVTKSTPHPLIHFIIARMYDTGANAPKNPKKAFEYYKLASQLGFEIAYCWLGECYEMGKGTDIDYDAALHWFKKAEDAHMPFGKYRYDFLLKKINKQ